MAEGLLPITFDVLGLAGVIAIIVVAVIANVIKSFKGGYLATVMDRYVYDETDEIYGRICEIQDTVDATYEATQKNGKNLHELSEAVVLLHRDDEDVDIEALRERIKVDTLPNDILKGHRYGRGADDDE